MEFSHFDEKGNAIMVDVSQKEDTKRTAIAKGTIITGKEIISKIQEASIQKGDVLSVSRIAGIMGAKKTSELIPLCHPLMLSKITIDFEVFDTSIDVYCTVSNVGKTGVEMEALTGVNVALLTIYDMCKAISKNMEITNIHLVSKSGGKSGEYVWNKE
ncbi:cyclic pyranopterin monophosphate synthase MoaC [Floccifex sp.]|uniref:cyclic pyranopterin monophosphate synthase MoaC n=1 Tax=Floccifex sp. TaxID=2815810 RepID=UPI002A754C58|nr:cyclic pyranopterin monophosphate synthase MoaC [Floccifex sp.]MDD7281365.1 cyclic pyranopterin monophosphate synthase MoaC [Erysipelotrichaceae bacterium]MDY2958896.1 cyclic pyranopterin monophosphate synthase MoaC [Floccifex sp.]